MEQEPAVPSLDETSMAMAGHLQSPSSGLYRGEGIEQGAPYVK
jgi:hypothetical protein